MPGGSAALPGHGSGILTEGIVVTDPLISEKRECVIQMTISIMRETTVRPHHVFA
jgi:hypothetical protein